MTPVLCCSVIISFAQNWEEPSETLDWWNWCTWFAWRHQLVYCLWICMSMCQCTIVEDPAISWKTRWVGKLLHFNFKKPTMVQNWSDGQRIWWTECVWILVRNGPLIFWKLRCARYVDIRRKWMFIFSYHGIVWTLVFAILIISWNLEFMATNSIIGDYHVLIKLPNILFWVNQNHH